MDFYQRISETWYLLLQIYSELHNNYFVFFGLGNKCLHSSMWVGKGKISAKLDEMNKNGKMLAPNDFVYAIKLPCSEVYKDH